MPVCFLLSLASAGGLSLRESVLRKRLIPRKRVWLRDASVGGRTGKPKGGATSDPAATRGGLRLWLTKAHVAQEGTRGEKWKPPWCLHSQDVVPQIFLLLKARPSTNFHVSREVATLLGFCISKVVPVESLEGQTSVGIQRLFSRFKTDSSLGPATVQQICMKVKYPIPSHNKTWSCLKQYPKSLPAC